MSNTINIPAKQARVKFGEIINQANYEGKSFVITKQGKPVARLEGIARPDRDENQDGKKSNKRKAPRFPEFDLGPTDNKVLSRKTIYADRLTRAAGH